MSEQQYDPDVLARRLDQALPAHKIFIPPVTPDPLVNSAAALAKLSLPMLSSQTSSRIEAQMLAAFDEQHHPHVVQRPRRRTPSVLSWALIASLALVVLLVGMTPAVAASLPGEPLYSVKQLYETVELSTATTSSAKAAIYLIHADRRAQEALSLLERNQFDPTLVSAALSNVAQAGQSANDVRASARLRGQVLEVNALVSFVLTNAQETGLVSSSDAAPLDQQVRQIEHSDLLIPLPSDIPDAAAATATATPTPTLSSTEEATETPSPEPGTSDGTPTCEHGQSCLSQGVPGGQVVPPTQKPTNVHRNTPSPPQGTPGGGNGNGNGNSSGTSNGGGDSAGGNSNGNGNGSGNSGGNGKGGG